jgi:protein TonB
MQQMKVTYVPYGAYSLKAAYQLNLFLAMGITILIVFTAVLGGWIAMKMTPEGPQLPEPGLRPVLTEFEWTRTPSIQTDSKPTPKGPHRPSTDIAGGPPVPVADSLFVDNGIQPPTREELADFYDGLYGDGPSTGTGELVIGDDTDVLPPPDQPVFCEIEPEMIYYVTPEYPLFAKKAGIAGNVMIQALISHEGNVLDARVYKSSGNRQLDEAAETAAYKNKYKPAVQNGRPIAIWVTYKVVFKLD